MIAALIYAGLVWTWHTVAERLASTAPAMA
jgi:hypothetical protein